MHARFGQADTRAYRNNAKVRVMILCRAAEPDYAIINAYLAVSLAIGIALSRRDGRSAAAFVD